ncbi:MAG: hypothetical protein HZC02_00845 [Candidatus Levybacteria bacterium]|nr:hypothetical protein [Candidatus Levybacteria bacterium]
MSGTKFTSPFKKQILSNNPIETGKSAVGDFTKELGNQVKQNIALGADDFMSQLLGIDTHLSSEVKKARDTSDMYPGQEVTLSPRAKIEIKSVEKAAAAINYHADIVRSSERGSSKENQEIQYQIEQIMDELKRLIASSDRVIQMAYGEVSVTSAPKIVGKYHTNFFSWMLTVIRTARQKVEDSGAWLASSKGKGGKRGYWSEFKKHGTSFGMSGERQVSTQTG